MLIVFTTTPNNEEAETLARKIVEEKLAACVQIIPQITSFYYWENEVRKDQEYLLLIKTLPDNFKALKDFIEANHSYSVPEIVGVNSEHISGKYAEWLESALNRQSLYFQP